MNNQELVIDNIIRYIQDDSGMNSSIMIKGEWGSGKTYFVKTVLIEKIKEEFENTKNLCYISLNGINDIKDIVKRIQSKIVKNYLEEKGKEKFLIFKEKTKGINSESMDIITGIDVLSDEINLQGILSVVKGVGKTIKNYLVENTISNTIFIFDDLERSAIEIDVILGTINDLIEHKKCKCIFVANEKELIKNEKNYVNFKEKFIFKTLEYTPDIHCFIKTTKEKYKNKPLLELSDEKWNELESKLIIQTNLRTIQSTMFLTNEVYEICLDRIIQEPVDVKQHVLYKIINDIYSVEDYYKRKGWIPESENQGKITAVYNLGFSSEYGSYQELFCFVIDIICNGNFDKKNILYSINEYIKNSKVKGSLSLIVKLKDYYQMEDEEIQKVLDDIYFSIKVLNLEQISEFLNSLIPLLDLGFKYGDKTSFEEVLNVVLNNMEILGNKKSLIYETVENHTTLKGKQASLYKKAIKEIKINFIDKESNENPIRNWLLKNNWAELLLIDMKENALDYRNNGRYLWYFDIEKLIDNLEKANNRELVRFRDVLYILYKRQNCREIFKDERDIALNFVSQLESLKIKRKINKLTINYIIGDLLTSFK